ncbi:hypothetical protein [uncultured Paracoccus sp.]|uniref:hypothetical protein n=1 Tax=uncultured Paracoccus sp. TaxID=189685 RepID=UPI0025FDC8FF|nr:hypothetical protein [uncultured Paracoccus sp.]
MIEQPEQTDDADVFDTVLRRVEQGLDPFAAARAEGVRFGDLYGWCRDQAAPGHHPYALLLDARAEWLTNRATACYDRLAQRVDAGLVRHRDIAEVERAAIRALATEARALRQQAADLRQFASVPPDAQLRAMEQEWGESAKSRQARLVRSQRVKPRGLQAPAPDRA